MKREGSSPIVRIILFTSIVLIVASLSVMIFTTPDPRNKRTDIQALQIGANNGLPVLDAGFSLTDSSGKQMSSVALKGKFVLIYFGFAHCPDICPASLTEMAIALDLLKSNASQVQPVFISLDPERDNPKTLKAYFDNFDKRFIALTGTKDQIKDVAIRYKVYAAKTPGDSKVKGDYMINHSAFYYLVDKDGKFVKYYAAGTKAQDMAKDLVHYVGG